MKRMFTSWKRLAFTVALFALPVATFAAHACGCCVLCAMGACPFC